MTLTLRFSLRHSKGVFFFSPRGIQRRGTPERIHLLMTLLAIIRQSFRTRANPLLVTDERYGAWSHADSVGVAAVILFDMRRVPSLNWRTTDVHSRRWSAHQFWFLLHVIREFMFAAARSNVSVRFVPYADRRQLEGEVRRLASKYDRALVDRVYDDAYGEMDEVIRGCFGERVRYIHTLTLVDWDKHERTARELVGSAFQRKKRRLLEDFIRKDAARHRKADVVAKVSRAQAAPDTSMKRLVQMIREFRSTVSHSAALKGAVDLYDFDGHWGVDCDLGTSLQRYMEHKCASMRERGWHKPYTAANLSMTQFSSEGRENTSKLSPFLAVGALDVREVFHFFRPGGGQRGSATDQLVFREVWYAHALVDDKRQTFWSNARGWWDPNNIYSATPPKEGETWESTAVDVRNWAMGKMDAAWEDANDSMKMLRRDGWIHHLRRHLVADVLCRGRLRKHFLYGEAWFRHTEIDHDAVINRANWLWLSATAFSTAQARNRHYNPETFVKRKSSDGNLFTLGRMCTDVIKRDQTPERARASEATGKEDT